MVTSDIKLTKVRIKDVTKTEIALEIFFYNGETEKNINISGKIEYPAVIIDNAFRIIRNMEKNEKKSQIRLDSRENPKEESVLNNYVVIRLLDEEKTYAKIRSFLDKINMKLSPTKLRTKPIEYLYNMKKVKEMELQL